MGKIGTGAIFAAAFLGWASSAATEELFCDAGSCRKLFTEGVPQRWSVPSLPRDAAKLTNRIRCEHFVRPYLRSLANEEWPRIDCSNIRIGSAVYLNDVGFSVRAIDYRGRLGKKRDESSDFFPSTILADRLLPYIPCHPTEFFDSDANETKPTNHPYLVKFPERVATFPCGYQLSGWGARPWPTEYRAAPFQLGFDEARLRWHRASTLVDEGLVANGRAFVEALLQDAEDEDLRKEMCRELGGSECVAPRLVTLRGNPQYDQALGFCLHDVVEDQVLPPNMCLFGALRNRYTQRYLIEAMITPNTFFPSGNGIGDADILCENKSGQNLLSILKNKYPETNRFRISEVEPYRVMRLGEVSDVYPNLRENFILRAVSRGENDVVLTPTIYFSPQNPPEQSQYRPISEIEYNYYSAKMFKRLAPELRCRDARDAK